MTPRTPTRLSIRRSWAGPALAGTIAAVAVAAKPELAAVITPTMMVVATVSGLRPRRAFRRRRRSRR